MAKEAPEVETGTKTKYQTMIIGVPAARKANLAKLDKLADSLACRRSDLIWSAVDALLSNPPKTAPAGAASNTGTAAGFWVIPVLDKTNGKCVSIRVKEVEKRADVTDGRTFFRYSADDDKGRTRALNQAIRAGQYDAKLLGFDVNTVKATTLPGAGK